MAKQSTKTSKKPLNEQDILEMNKSLVKENKRLKNKLNQTEDMTNPTLFGKSWRVFGIVVLAGFAGALLLVCNTLFWGARTVVDTQQYEKVTTNLIKDPAVQQAISIYATDRIFENNDIEGAIQSALPPRADFLAPTLQSGLKSRTQEVIQNVVESQKFQNTFITINVAAHENILRVANSPEGRDGVINLNEVYQQLSSNLNDTKLSFLASKPLPSGVGQITILESNKLKVLHVVSSNIDKFKYISLGLIFASSAAAVWLSRNRRKMFIVLCLMFASLMLATLLGLRVATAILANSVLLQYQAATRSAIGIILQPFVIQSVTILTLSLVAFMAAFLSGPSRTATNIRDRLQLLFQGKAHRALFAKENSATLWVDKYKSSLRIFCLLLVSALMLRVQLTPTRILVFTLVALLLLAVIELLSATSKTSRR